MAIPGEYMIIIILIVVGFIFYMHFNKRKNIRSLKIKIEGQWAKEPSVSYNSNEIASIASYSRNKEEEAGNSHRIDEITWNDLDMDRVFMRMNNTQTTIGEEYLYNMLHEPLFEEDKLEERNRLMEYFRENPAERSELQILLARMGKSKYLNISEYFFNHKKEISVKSIFYKLLTAVCLLSPLMLAIDTGLGISLMAFSIATNIFVYFRSKNRISGYLESLSYIISMVITARKVSNIGMDGIKEYCGELSSSVRKVKSVINKSFWLLYVTDNIFVEYLRTVLLGELIAFEGMFKVMYRHSEEFKKIYETIGFLDSIISLASYRESIHYFTTPVLTKAPDRSGIRISALDAYHPLISKPVPNTIEITKSVLITGSNASGKSTFLKTAAINAIFAQTIFTCLAREYSSSYFAIFSSMALKDNLKGNESYYMAEIRSLKRIFDSINSSIPCLCLIDEVLRGTNTIERIAASSEVLFHLSSSNCLCIAATHDIELTYILRHAFENFHFQEAFTENDIVFDYKIYPGRSNSRNAIKLLRFMGYDESIVKSAESRALIFQEDGIWKDIPG